MAYPKGFHLFVNLSAARTKQRLKGFGHGVRKIQSAGRNQAVIIHTATGHHLRELQALFADVGCGECYDELSEPIENLRNIGATTGQWLRDTGIRTIADLQAVGATSAFRRVQLRHNEVSWNLLWSLVAGLQDRDWRELSDADKQRVLSDSELE